jgi:hypothetical protein
MCHDHAHMKPGVVSGQVRSAVALGFVLSRG